MPSVMRVQHVSVPMPPDGNDEARAFYGGVLGLPEVVPPSTLNRDRLVWFNLGEDGHELHVFTYQDFAYGCPGQHLCLQVDDLEAYREKIQAAGLEILPEPEIHNRPRFSVRDPFRNRIEITQIIGAYDELDA